MMGLDPYVAGETNSDGRTGNIYSVLDFFIFLRSLIPSSLKTDIFLHEEKRMQVSQVFHRHGLWYVPE